jgi:hypothetical protein
VKNYRTLDAMVVCACLALLGFVFWALIFRVIPQANLPILSGLVGATVGSMLTMYAGARWGNKKNDEPRATATVTPPDDAT